MRVFVRPSLVSRVIVAIFILLPCLVVYIWYGIRVESSQAPQLVETDGFVQNVFKAEPLLEGGTLNANLVPHSLLVPQISYRELSVGEAFGLPQDPALKPRYDIKKLQALYQAFDPNYYDRNLTIEGVVNNWESLVGCNSYAQKLVDPMVGSVDQNHTYKTFFGLLHAHTGDSDGLGTPEKALLQGRDVAGLDFMGISDHSDFWLLSRGRQWKDLKVTTKRLSTANFLAVPAFEYSSFLLGHYLVLGTEHFRSTYEDIDLASFYSWLKEPAQKNAMVIFAHPGYHAYRRMQDQARFAFDAALRDRFVGMEVLHRNVYKNFLKGFGKKIPYIDEAIQKGWRVGSVASQDNHKDNWAIQDSSRVAVLLPKLTHENFFDALRKRRFYATHNESLHFAVNIERANGNWDSMGAELRREELPPQHAKVKVRYADLYGGEPPSALEVVVNGRVEGKLNFVNASPQEPIEKVLDFFEKRRAPRYEPKLPNPYAGEFDFLLPLPNGNVGELLYFYVRFYQGEGRRFLTQSSPIFIQF